MLRAKHKVLKKPSKSGNISVEGKDRVMAAPRTDCTGWAWAGEECRERFGQDKPDSLSYSTTLFLFISHICNSWVF